LSQEHAATLLNLTGDLFPAGVTTAAQLTELRQILLVALRAGETPADIGLREFAGEPVNGAEAEIAALGDADPLPPSPNRLARRSAAIRAADQVTGGPQWTLAQTPAVTLGPFQDGGGCLHWFDIYTPEPTFFILPKGAPGPIALLPPETARTGAATLTIPGGNLWLAGPSIHASAPAGSGRTKSRCHLAGYAGYPGSCGLSGNGHDWRFRQWDWDFQSGAWFPDGVRQHHRRESAECASRCVRLRSRTAQLALSDDARCGHVHRDTDADGGLFPMSGSAVIQSAAWAIPVTVVVGDAFADLEGPGSLAVTVGGNIALNQSTILVTPDAPRYSPPRLRIRVLLKR
jgi:hypothetical protein